MSSDYANLSFNMVDDVALAALRACTSRSEFERWLADRPVLRWAAAEPEAIAAALAAVKEAAAPGEDLSDFDPDPRKHLLSLYDEGRFPEIVVPSLIADLLRADRARFTPLAIDLWETEEIARTKLEELAFPHGEVRWGGELWLTSPGFVLAAFSPTFARYLVGAIDNAKPPPAWTGPDREPMFGAICGGLDRNTWPEAVYHRAADVARLAPQLANIAVPALHPYLTPYADEYDSLDTTIEQYVANAIAEIAAFYAKAAAEGLGVEAYWHANP